MENVVLLQSTPMAAPCLDVAVAVAAHDVCKAADEAEDEDGDEDVSTGPRAAPDDAKCRRVRIRVDTERMVG